MPAPTARTLAGRRQAQDVADDIQAMIDARVTEALKRAGVIGTRVDTANFAGPLYVVGGIETAIVGTLVETTGGSAAPAVIETNSGTILGVVACFLIPPDSDVVVALYLSGTDVGHITLTTSSGKVYFPVADVLSVTGITAGDDLKLDVLTADGGTAQTLTVGLAVQYDVSRGVG